MNKLTILGNTHPIIGKKEMYSIVSLTNTRLGLSHTPFGELIKTPKREWDVMIQTKTGWRKANNNKEGDRVPYTFGQKSLKYKGIKIVVRQGEDYGELIIHPQRAKEQRISKVELLDVNYQKIPKGKKISYKDTIIARAYCIEMFNMPISFTLWEDDANGEGHNPMINGLNRINLIPVFDTVNEDGIAQVSFRLPEYTLAVQIANARTALGEKDEGATHEYYVTADAVESHIQKASANVNVINPTYNPVPTRKREMPKMPIPPVIKPEIVPAKPKPEMDSPKFAITPGGKNREDVEGRLLSAEFVDENGNKLHSSRVGTLVFLKILAKDMKDKKVKIKIWEEDNFLWTHDLIFEKDLVLVGDTNFTWVHLTRKLFDKAKDGGTDSSRQDYFIEVIYRETSVKSAVMPVTLDAIPTEVSKGRSAAVIKEPISEKREDKICECEAKVKAFMRMIRIGEGTEDEDGYTRIVGGSSFADYGKNMSTHPKVYISKYDSTAAGAYQITKTNWNSDNFASWRNDNNVNDFSKESQDIYCVYLIIKKKKAFDNINSGDIDGAISKCSKEWASLPGAGYGQREESREKIKEKYKDFLKQELRGSSNLYIKAGFLEKYFGINCCKDLPKVEKSDSSDIIVEFDGNIEEERRKVVSEKTKNILKKAAKSSGNKKVVITSTIRSPRKQAEAMYNNEKNGKHIKYATPGRQVLDIYNQTKSFGREKTINAMIEKIVELSKQGKRVSLHCVAESEYAKLNIIDVSYIKGLTDYKKFILDVANDSSVFKIIHPIKSIGTSGKINYDEGEPAIHIEIKQ
ncbi:glycoside hydrolase family 24 protein [Chryseobacterium potabilaquae]|uniref:Lysozyme n=1 Tax=Chryseobacterium potabilaquae TaxID=2675057 RepID=A0A6N4XFB8_9FLAO|nr:glycoside hydrolase family 104 protein [Chryseobacterium potabilaquae]CAA7197358.1 hypothetical protein CHRY9293_03413 [Chryseobacterium potabilaquae]